MTTENVPVPFFLFPLLQMITSSKDLQLGREAYARIKQYKSSSKKHLIGYLVPFAWLVISFVRCEALPSLYNKCLTLFWFVALIWIVIAIHNSSKTNVKDQAFIEDLKKKYGSDIDSELEVK
jgi:hypothetical protein